MSGYQQCQDLVRAYDRDRYLAALFCPADARPHVFALLAFNSEIARTREMISDPMPGEFRLQWWSDAISGNPHGDIAANPVAQAVLKTVSDMQVPTEPLLELIRSRIFDLYDDPMESFTALRQYCDKTSSILFELSVGLISRATSDQQTVIDAKTFEHAGQAYALTGLLRALPLHLGRWQCYIPSDLLARYSLEPKDTFDMEYSPEMAGALRDMRELAGYHCSKVGQGIRQLPKSALPAFLPLSLIGSYLEQMEANEYDPFKTRIDIPGWQKIWLMWRAAQNGKRLN